eukprot:TRINITY_DN106982_c0_g1_i1.p1 TRINITY_DN106982_c0_g1~~TRINITY_DN106982_c0_g1_i1.p1  ORF type:complete len:106 (+),score=25.50 TRINITY_DN106982_c0_g1_i1:92-409(+)
MTAVSKMQAARIGSLRLALCIVLATFAAGAAGAASKATTRHFAAYPSASSNIKAAHAKKDPTSCNFDLSKCNSAEAIPGHTLVQKATASRRGVVELTEDPEEDQA